jgi:hypothetical protein
MKTAASAEGAKGSKKKLDLSTFAVALGMSQEVAAADATVESTVDLVVPFENSVCEILNLNNTHTAADEADCAGVGAAAAVGNGIDRIAASTAARTEVESTELLQFLNSVTLLHCLAALIEVGITSLPMLRQCEDSFLLNEAGLKKAYIMKIKRALQTFNDAAVATEKKRRDLLQDDDAQPMNNDEEKDVETGASVVRTETEVAVAALAADDTASSVAEVNSGLTAEHSILEGLAPDDAAELVWLKLRDFAEQQGPHGVADAFKRFDTDGSGVLDPKELKAALATVGLPGASNKVVESVMKTAASAEGAKGSKKKLDLSTFAVALGMPQEVAAADEPPALADAEITDDHSLESRLPESDKLTDAAVVDAEAKTEEHEGAYRTADGFNGSFQDCFEHEKSEGPCMRYMLE